MFTNQRFFLKDNATHFIWEHSEGYELDNLYQKRRIWHWAFCIPGIYWDGQYNKMIHYIILQYQIIFLLSGIVFQKMSLIMNKDNVQDMVLAILFFQTILYVFSASIVFFQWKKWMFKQNTLLLKKFISSLEQYRNSIHDIF